MSADNGPYWYSNKTIAEIVDEYGRVRGDLTEQYARDQLTSIIEGRVAKAKVEALREVADDYSVNLSFMVGPQVRRWLRDHADQVEAAQP